MRATQASEGSIKRAEFLSNCYQMRWLTLRPRKKLFYQIDSQRLCPAQHSLLPDVRPVARQHLENFLGEARPQPARTLCPGQPHELSWMPAPWLSAAPALLSRSLPPTIARCRRCPRPRAGCTSPSTSCSLQIPLQLNTSAAPLGGAVFSPELLPA